MDVKTGQIILQAKDDGPPHPTPELLFESSSYGPGPWVLGPWARALGPARARGTVSGDGFLVTISGDGFRGMSTVSH